MTEPDEDISIHNNDSIIRKQFHKKTKKTNKQWK